MTWSLLNHMQADKVAQFLDGSDPMPYGPEVERSMPRETAMAVIHAVIWAHSSRAGSTASAYAYANLYAALKLKDWTFDDEGAGCLREFRRARHYPKMTAADLGLTQ